MRRKKEAPGDSCCAPAGCRVESLVTVDDRGQMVLPKELREKAGIRGGDKFAVVTWVRGDKVCCLSLVKAEELGGMVKELLGPLMGGLIRAK